jgi:uncharacterized repeat protein (TIGR02543 family)
MFKKVVLFFGIILLSSCTVEQHKVTFNTYSESTIDSIFVESSKSITEPNAPLKEGYTFSGWYEDSTFNIPYSFSMPVVGDLILHAKWNINQYTITFDTDGGSKISSITRDYNTEVTAPNNPTREGYTFLGWDKALPETMPAENVTLTALWQINQ